MRKYSHLFFTSSISTLLIVCGVVGYGFTASSAYAQTSQNSSQLAEIKDQIHQLFELQDSITIPQQEKDIQELKLRRTILTLIVAETQKQTNTAYDEFKNVQLPNSDDWKQIDTSIRTSFEAAQKYYTDVENRISNDPNITSSLLKNIARDMEEKKTQEIDPLIKKSHAIVATFNITDMLKVGEDRLAKITLDVDKIYAQKLTRSNTLKQLLEKAATALTQARELNNSSKETILYAYAPSETGSSTEFIDTLYKKLTQNRATSTPQSTSSPDPIADVIQSYIQKTITDSISNIKSVYDTFIKMSSNVKSYLK